MSTIYTVQVTRDDRWWMIHIPELDDAHGLVGEAITQARRYADIETEARDYICTVTDSAPSAVALTVTAHAGTVAVNDVVAEVKHLREQATEYDRKAADMTTGLVRQLAADGVPVRDIGSILGVSHQRASQLAALS